MISTINLQCNNCGKTFTKTLSEFKRNEKNNSKNYCSRKCAAIVRNINRDYSNFKPHPNFILNSLKKKDEFSPFREFIRRIKYRCSKTNEIFDLDLIYLKELWEKQEGKCIYTKIELILPVYNTRADKIFTASLDRIDSKKSYIKGNVQYVSTAINYMKNDMSHENTVKICILIAKNLNS